MVKFGTNSQFPTFCPTWCCAFGIGGVVEPKTSDSGDCSDTTNKPKNKNTSSRKVCEGEVETECHIWYPWTSFTDVYKKGNLGSWFPGTLSALTSQALFQKTTQNLVPLNRAVEYSQPVLSRFTLFCRDNWIIGYVVFVFVFVFDLCLQVDSGHEPMGIAVFIH